MIVRPSSGITTPWWYTFPNASNYTVVGSGAVWGDDSDATYVQFVANDFTPMPTAVFPATATDQDPDTVFVRCQAVSGTVYIGWELRDFVSAEMFSQHSTPDVLVPGEITSLEIPWDALNGTGTSALNAGNLCVTVEAKGGTGTVRIYDAWVVWGDPQSTHIPPLRQIRRNDGLRGSVRSLRVRSRQRSLRQGPGSIL